MDGLNRSGTAASASLVFGNDLVAGERLLNKVKKEGGRLSQAGEIVLCKVGGVLRLCGISTHGDMTGLQQQAAGGNYRNSTLTTIVGEIPFLLLKRDLRCYITPGCDTLLICGSNTPS